MRIVLLLTLAMAAPPCAAACTCVAPELGACGLAQSAAAIFTGRVAAEERSEWVTTYTFTVTEAFRGSDVGAGLAVKVGTPTGGASCGASFQVGEEYLVFAHTGDGTFATSLCSGNELVKNAKAQLRFLRATGQDAIAKGTPLPGFVFGSVTNRVSDLRKTGEPSWPVEGVKVKAVHAATGTIASETTTAKDGSYEFFHLPPGRYRIETEPRGAFQSAADSHGSHVVQPGVCVGQSFFRAQRALLEVRLVDSDGEPADDCTLHLAPVGAEKPGASLPGEPSELIAEDESAEGRYRFAVPPGRYRLGFKEPGYLELHDYPGELLLSEFNPVILHYRLPKRARQVVQATVSYEDGRPAAGIQVRISGKTPDGWSVGGSVLTPATGRIEFDSLSPGDYELTVDAPGCPASVKVAASDSGEVQIVCKRPGIPTP